jgi:hypothetical protein
MLHLTLALFAATWLATIHSSADGSNISNIKFAQQDIWGPSSVRGVLYQVCCLRHMDFQYLLFVPQVSERLGACVYK